MRKGKYVLIFATSYHYICNGRVLLLSTSVQKPPALYPMTMLHIVPRLLIFNASLALTVIKL